MSPAKCPARGIHRLLLESGDGPSIDNATRSFVRVIAGLLHRRDEILSGAAAWLSRQVYVTVRLYISSRPAKGKEKLGTSSQWLTRDVGVAFAPAHLMRIRQMVG